MNQKKLLKVLSDFTLFAKAFLQIRTKNGAVKAFKLNRAQLYLHERLEQQLKETGKVRAIICKGRQQGCSTYIQARDFYKVSTQVGKKAFILTHESEATKNLFEMTKRYYDLAPYGLLPQPDTSSAKELNFKSLNSGYAVGTAGNKAVGRSQTIQLFHGCLGKGSRIFDPDTGGVKYIEDFTVGDKILTHTGQRALISYISSQSKECLSITFRGLSNFPLVATPEHKFWTKEGWKALNKLNLGDSIGYPVKPISKQISDFYIPKANNRVHGGGRQFECPDSIVNDYALGRFIGLYLADGHIKLQDKYPHYPCALQIVVHRKEVERTIEWLTPFFDYFSSFKVKHREDSLTTEINITGNRFISMINVLCGRTTNKHFPRNWDLMGEEFCQGLLLGYLAGDGSSYGDARRIRATSICASLTVTARDICASLGYGWASIEHKQAAIRAGRNEKEAYTFALCGNGVSQIAKILGKPSPQLTRTKTNSIKNKAAKTTEISSGYAWLTITRIGEVGMQPVYDFEVDHPDHSYCTIHGSTHNSEVAYWPNAEEHAKGILQAVPNEPGTEIILESTANGIGNYYYNMWQSAISGQSDFQAIFIPWYWQDEYTLPDDGSSLTDEELHYINEHGANGLTREHLMWRRKKLHEFDSDYEQARELFNVEYPFTALDAFRNPVADRFIKVDIVNRAMKNKVESQSPLVIGVDPAISDNDRTAIIRRKGRLVYNLETHYNLNTMELVGLVRRIIDKEHPVKVCIDCIGIGAGIVDRLLEIGYTQVEGVNVARSANEKDKFKNLRAELWHDMREWLSQELPVQLPDSDELRGDLTGLGYHFDSSGRLQIESKEKAKKRGIRSPDIADAVALTFAVGDFLGATLHNTKKMPDRWASSLA